MKRVDEHTFSKVKSWLHILPAKKVAHKFDLHESTVLNIRGCKSFFEYKEIVKAEHPATKYSLRDDVLSIHRQLFDKHDGNYFSPNTAQIAMREINKVKLTVKA